MGFFANQPVQFVPNQVRSLSFLAMDLILNGHVIRFGP